jgi:glycosyltransferase involved in cell wall biosynthesis
MAMVSVIVPCYNYGKFISETLDSVLEQTYDNWECIIIDDGSTDNSKEIISCYTRKDKRFTYIYQENKGLSAARNTGINAAKGDFLLFLDSDDKIKRRKLEMEVAFLDDNPHVDIVYGDARYFVTDRPGEHYYSMGMPDKPWMPKVSGKGKELLKHLIKENILVVSAALVRKRSVTVCGFFDETLKVSEDWDFWIRCALQNLYFAYLESPETGTLIRSHSTSMSKNMLAMFTSSLELQRNWIKYIKNTGCVQFTRSELYKINSYIYKKKKHLALEKLRRNIRLEGMYELLKYSIVGLDLEYILYGLFLFCGGSNIDNKVSRMSLTKGDRL